MWSTVSNAKWPVKNGFLAVQCRCQVEVLSGEWGWGCIDWIGDVVCLIRQLLLGLAEWLCANHNADERAARIVRDMHLFLLPTMNPDGFEAHQRGNARKVHFPISSPCPLHAMPLKPVVVVLARRLRADLSCI